jgi:hypothetical protein
LYASHPLRPLPCQEEVKISKNKTERNWTSEENYKVTKQKMLLKIIGSYQLGEKPGLKKMSLLLNFVNCCYTGQHI